MARRLASINDLPIREADRKYRWRSVVVLMNIRGSQNLVCKGALKFRRRGGTGQVRSRFSGAPLIWRKRVSVEMIDLIVCFTIWGSLASKDCATFQIAGSTYRLFRIAFKNLADEYHGIALHYAEKAWSAQEIQYWLVQRIDGKLCGTERGAAPEFQSPLRRFQ
jgi:hypothetical protein